MLSFPPRRHKLRLRHLQLAGLHRRPGRSMPSGLPIKLRLRVLPRGQELPRGGLVPSLQSRFRAGVQLRDFRFQAQALGVRGRPQRRQIEGKGVKFRGSRGQRGQRIRAPQLPQTALSDRLGIGAQLQRLLQHVAQLGAGLQQCPRSHVVTGLELACGLLVDGRHFSFHLAALLADGVEDGVCAIELCPEALRISQGLPLRWRRGRRARLR
mmetsp:Transcript_87951/g.252084  ORF Transcript_87951/g.252084 Transcript_87951/m.252084 type:complete len:211 (-) Transcript_87951:510-1142(-)